MPSRLTACWKELWSRRSHRAPASSQRLEQARPKNDRAFASAFCVSFGDANAQDPTAVDVYDVYYVYGALPTGACLLERIAWRWYKPARRSWRSGMMPTDGSGGFAGGGSRRSGRDDGVPSPGEVFAGKYEVERVLGVGGMGVVLAARHLQLGQLVAVKFMLAAYARDSTAVERFLREARAAAALSSEHVARVTDVGTLESGAPYIVMEYLAGRDLGQILKSGGPMAISSAVDLMLQACDAIAEAHALGIVHRDLKPSNLFVTSRREGTPLVKVLDFGISKAAGPGLAATSQALTDSGVVMGSPMYMSPEQVRSAKSADARSDIWALGVIVYQLLTGVTPFEGETMGETLAYILSEEPPPIRSRRADVPAGLEAAVLQCLQRDIDRRVQSVTQLARLLAPFASPEMAPLVERIARMSTPRASTRSDTPAAGDPMSARAASLTLSAGPSEASVQREETGPAWLKSTSNGAHPGPPLGRYLALLAAALIVAIGIGAAALLRKDAPASGAAARAVPPSASPPTALPTSDAVRIPAIAPVGAPHEDPAPSLRDRVTASPLDKPASGAAAPSSTAAPKQPRAAQPPARPARPASTVTPKPAGQPTSTVPDFGY